MRHSFRRMLTGPHGLALLLAMLLLAPAPTAAEHGRAAPVPVGAFLNGVLPPRTPLAPGTSTWAVASAFPNLALENTLVIVAHPDPAANRLYLGSRAGEIVYVPYQPEDPAITTASPFLDLRDRVAVVWDGGFLGMALHPQLGVAGSPFRYLYVWYSSHCPIDSTGTSVDLGACDPSFPTEGTDGFFGTWLRLSRFEVPDGQLTADPASERVMINHRLVNRSHRGGGMLFAKDGYLYVSSAEQFNYETAQDIAANLEGGVLRLAVDVIDHGDGTWTCPAGSHAPRRRLDKTEEVSGLQYCIPDDNPWLDPTGTTFEEYYSIGHRNVHRMTQDPVSGRIWAGEVGESTREEINIVQKGHNYGWPFREGTVAGPRPEPAQFLGTLTEPVIDFDRNEANAVIGGFVYRGAAFPELQGRFLAGDYVTQNVWAITLNESDLTGTAEVIANFTPGGLATWGRAPDAELLMGSVVGPGPLHRLVRVGDLVFDPPALLSQLEVFDDLAALDPASYWLPYDLNVARWSDGAQKQQWVAVPNDGSHDTPAEQVGWSESGDWSWPVGTVLMQHFELALDENNPQATTRLETRFLAHGDDGQWYGLSYRWLPDQTDAELLSEGATEHYTVQTPSGPRQQTWLFPSRIQCSQCHSSGLGGVAGPRTHQLNADLLYADTGITDNQLRTWNHLGMFSPSIIEAQIPTMLAASRLEDVTAPLENRVRAWLDSNCSNCHRPGTGNRVTFDARLTTPLAQQGLVGAPAINRLGMPDPALIAAGDPTNSTVYMRAAALGGIAMPPLAKGRVHDSGVDRLGAWITRIDSSVVSGVTYEYYELADLEVLPDFDAFVADETGSVSNFDLSVRNRDDGFAIRYRGVVEIVDPGTYDFFARSDDGSRLLIGGAVVVDNDGLHAYHEQSGSVVLGTGWHAIEVQYFENAGGEVLTVSWDGPTFAKQPIPADALRSMAPRAGLPPSVEPHEDVRSRVGQAVAVAITASDPDGSPLHIEAAGLPPGLSMDPNSGVISGTALPGGEGSYRVTIGVSDGPGAASTQFDWVVTSAGGRCGLGFELVLALSVLAAARPRQRG